MTKILIKRGQAEANLPTLDPGEPAITFDSGGKLWIGTPSGNLEITGGGSGTPGGADTQVQFNDGGSFGGSANFTWDGTANQLLVGGATSADSTAVLEAHDSIADTRFNIVNDTASADGNLTNVGFYLKNAAEEFTPYAFWVAGSTDRTDGSEDGFLSVALIRNGTITITTRYGTAETYLNYNSDNIDTIIYGSSDSFTAMVDAGENAFQVGFLAPGNIADFRHEGVVFNESGNDRDFRVEGDTATNLIVVDAGLDAFQIGTTVTGAIADFRSTSIVLNNAEADVDIRWGGNGVTNGVYFDAGNIRFGINTVPSVALHVIEDSGTVAIFEENASGEVGINSFYNPNTTDNNGSLIRFDTDTTGTGAATRSQIAQIGVVFTTHNHATRTGNIVFRNYQSGSFGTRVTIGSGVQVGSPTGGDKGSGTANFAGDIYKNNTAFTSPDFVQEHYFTGKIEMFSENPGAVNYNGLLPIHLLENFMRENLCLPGRSDEPMGIFERSDLVQQWIEELALYITQLHNRVNFLEMTIQS